jgi:hypothetical protein
MIRYVFCKDRIAYSVFINTLLTRGVDVVDYMYASRSDFVHGMLVGAYKVVILGSFASNPDFEEIKELLRSEGYTGGFPGTPRFGRGGVLPPGITGHDTVQIVYTNIGDFVSREQPDYTTIGVDPSFRFTAPTSGTYTSHTITVPGGTNNTTIDIPDSLVPDEYSSGIHQQLYQELLDLQGEDDV